MSLRIIYENCDPDMANDKTLPYNAYLVEYVKDDYMDDELCYDIVIPNKKVDIFDHYWDKYREGFRGFKQTEGRVNPKLWGSQQSAKKKK